MLNIVDGIFLDDAEVVPAEVEDLKVVEVEERFSTQGKDFVAR